MKTLKDLKIKSGTKVLLRVDYNVPISNSKLQDAWRIIQTLPTIKYLLEREACVILMSHLGRPGGMVKKELSLKSVAEYVGRKLRVRVDFLESLPGEADLKKHIHSMSPGTVVMLENLRFAPGEDAADPGFARALAELGQVYVNDAFGASHRKSASITLLPKLLPHAAGLLLEQEVQMLGKIVSRPAKPMVLLMGGAKVSDKIGVIKNLIKSAHKVLLGGALANNFFAAMGYSIGNSLYDKKEVALAKSLLKQKKIFLPYDVVVGVPGKPRSAKVVVLGDKDKLAAKGEAILDIGPLTINRYAAAIKEAATIVWNGPMGYTEEPQFSHGTAALMRVLAARSKGKAFGVLGGGESVEALRRTKMEDMVDWVSTGGGAMLEFLEGKSLPGIKVLS